MFSYAIALGKVLHPIGLAFSSLVLVTLIVLACIDLKHMNRITIRLIGAIAIGDFINHLSEMLAIGTERLLGSPYCVGLTVFRTFGKLFYGFSNLAICFHLYRSVVKLKKSTCKYELVVWLTMLYGIGLIMLAFHFMGFFTGTINKRACIFGSDNPLFSKVATGFIGSLHLSTIIISVYVTILCRKNINNWVNAYASVQIDEEAQKQFKEDQRKIVKRSFLYPLSTLITISAESILSFSIAFGYPLYQIMILVNIGNGLAGILTAVAFAIDPALWKSIHLARNQVLNWYHGVKNPNSDNIQMNLVNNSVPENPSQIIA